MSSFKRILNEFKELRSFIDSESIDSHRLIDIENISDDIYNIKICFIGPKETPYEETLNNILINIPIEYPNKPPNIKFINKIYHPNISTEGIICLDILKENWKPIYSLRTIMMSIISLLSEPNPESPLNGDAARLFRDGLKSKIDRIKYLNKVMEFDIK